VLRVWRRIECNKYPLNSNKNRASHMLHLPFFCGHRPLNCLFCLLGFWRAGK
jgi:hypothetical protein